MKSKLFTNSKRKKSYVLLSPAKNTVKQLKAAPMFQKPAVAERLADQSYALIESQQARITVLEMQVQQLIKGGINVS